MLIKLEKPMSYTTHVVPVCLPVGNLTDRYKDFGEIKDERYEELLVVGWGRTQQRPNYRTKTIASQAQNKLQLPMISHQMCVEKLENLFGTHRRLFDRDQDQEEHLCWR